MANLPAKLPAPEGKQGKSATRGGSGKRKPERPERPEAPQATKHRRHTHEAGESSLARGGPRGVAPPLSKSRERHKAQGALAAQGQEAQAVAAHAGGSSRQKPTPEFREYRTTTASTPCEEPSPISSRAPSGYVA